MPTKLPPTAIEATPYIVQVKTGDYALLAYDLEKVKSENGLTAYQVGVAIQNTSDHVIIVTDIPAAGAQAVTEDGGTFAAQLLRYWQITNDRWLQDSEMSTYVMIPPCAVVVDEHEPRPADQGYQTDGWLFSFEMPERFKPIVITVPGLPDIDLEHMSSAGELRFGTTCPESALPLVFTTGANIKVAISNARQTQDQYMRRILALDVDLENLNSGTDKGVAIHLGLTDPEGTEIQFMTTCDNPQRSGHLTYGRNDIGPGQLVEGEVCFELKPDSYYVWPVWETVATLDPKELGLDPDGPMTVEGVQTTFEELRNVLELADGRRLVWVGNKRLGHIEIQKRGSPGIRVKRNLGDVYYLAISVDDQTGWATIRLP